MRWPHDHADGVNHQLVPARSLGAAARRAGGGVGFGDSAGAPQPATSIFSAAAADKSLLQHQAQAGFAGRTESAGQVHSNLQFATQASTFRDAALLPRALPWACNYCRRRAMVVVALGQQLSRRTAENSQ
jgi:hypothetical protein